MAKTVEQVQYYKVINPAGHHGLVFHLGENSDPKAIKPISKVGSCEVGAIYFTTKEYLYRFKRCGRVQVNLSTHVEFLGEK